MAWVDYPPATGVDVSSYPWVIQLWQAARKRAWMIGSQFWPRTNFVWASGPADNLADNGDGTYTLTDDHAATSVATNRWFGFSDPFNTWIPPYYKIVFDDLDETKIASSPIGGSDYAAGVATYKIDKASLQAFVDSRQIPSIASLIGKKYYVIVSWGIWWHDRWIEWPNDHELWKGASTSSTTTSLTDATATWFTHEFQPVGPISYELRMPTGPGIPILDNIGNKLTFAAQAAPPSGNYAIVKAGARWRNQKPGQRRAWYRGAMEQFWSHYPDGTLQGTKEAKVSVTLAGGAGCGTSFSQNLFDEDFWTAVDDICNTPDLSYCPDLFKTYRGIQLFIEGICQWFVDKNLNYNGRGSIPFFALATLFRAAGINAYTTTVSALSGDGVTIPTQSFPFTPVDVCWAVLDATGNVQNAGNGTAMSNTDIAAGSFTAADVGKTLVVSLGWSEFLVRAFRYFYDRWQFIPSISTGALGDPPAGTPVVPPTSASPGLWKFRPKSTKYRVCSPTGIVEDGPDSFVDQVVARYFGDNWNDPTIFPLIDVATGDATLLPWYNNFYTGKRGPTEAALDAMPAGTSTGGSTTQLQDASLHMWGSVMWTASGTADSGSPTSLGDSTKISDGRWNSATGRWIGAIVKITVGGTVYRRPITGFSGTTISWTEALPGGATGSGKYFEIDEPGAGSSSVVSYERNRFAGRTLTVTDPSSGTTYPITILYNDDNTFYFSSQSFTIGADWSYSTSEEKPGRVWKWDAASGKHVVPTGTDPRTGKAWRHGQFGNLPYKAPRFGKLLKHDYWGPHVPKELHDAFEQLEWTAITPTWDPQLVDGTPEINYWQAADLSYNSYASGKAFFASAWAAAPDSGTDPSLNSFSGSNGSASGPPFAAAGCARAGGGPGTGSAFSWNVTGSRLYCYPVASVPPYLNSIAEIYVYGTINAADTPPDATHTFDANGDSIAYHVWTKIQTMASSNTPTRKGAAFGNPALPAPNPPSEPTTSGTGLATDTTFNGYYAAGVTMILKWDSTVGAGG